MNVAANAAQLAKMMDFVATCSDPEKLRQVAHNAKLAGADALHREATLRLYKISPSEQPGTFEYDVWHSIYALEGSLSEERGKTIRLSRTRQKITRDGEQKTVADLIVGKQSQGFDLLIERGLPQLTFEALALKHTDRFSSDVCDAASARMSNVKEKSDAGG